MKKIVIILVVLISSLSYSQEKIDSINNITTIFPIEINVYANFTNEMGFAGSITSSVISINKNSIHIGAKYGQYNCTFNHLKEEISTDNRTYYKVKDNISAIEVPIYFRHTFDNDVFLNLGFSYGINFKSKFNSEYYRSSYGTFYDKTELIRNDITNYGNIIGGIGFQKLYENYGFNLRLNFLINSLSLNTNNQDYYFGSIPNLTNISASVGFILK